MTKQSSTVYRSLWWYMAVHKFSCTVMWRYVTVYAGILTEQEHFLLVKGYCCHGARYKLVQMLWLVHSCASCPPLFPPSPCWRPAWTRHICYARKAHWVKHKPLYSFALIRAARPGRPLLAVHRGGLRSPLSPRRPRRPRTLKVVLERPPSWGCTCSRQVQRWLFTIITSSLL
jgi:hypothetical protein